VDYRALAELIMMGLLGLSVLTLAVGFSVRAFLAPTLREVFERLSESREQGPALGGRVDRFDERLARIEETLERLEAAQSFDRQLESPES
jgi:hypothetical protein